VKLLEVVVEHRWRVAQGIAGFELILPGGLELPSYEAGSHIDVHLPNGLVRQYSLCGDPQERMRWRIAVLRESASRGGSAALHDGVHVGDRLKVGVPRNLFALADAPEHLLIGGGIGITPLLAMARSLHAGARPFQLHACYRSPAHAAFAEELAASPFAGQVHLHFDDASDKQKFDVTQVLASAGPGSQTHLYVCGPAGFIDYVLSAARRLGWAEQRLHREHFAPVPAPKPTTTAAEGAFELRLARSGRTLAVPADRSVLQVLLGAGVDVPCSCEAGVCGTCVLPVLEGVPDHRDSFLTPAERDAGGTFVPCCSRALTPVLVVDA
jgi:vanillate O-demethylase ferredoxin subunit